MMDVPKGQALAGVSQSVSRVGHGSPAARPANNTTGRDALFSCNDPTANQGRAGRHTAKCGVCLMHPFAPHTP